MCFTEARNLDGHMVSPDVHCGLAIVMCVALKTEPFVVLHPARRPLPGQPPHQRGLEDSSRACCLCEEAHPYHRIRPMVPFWGLTLRP